MMENSDYFETGERAAKIGFITVLTVGLLKGIIGILSDSVSLQAQSIDSITDLFSLVAVYVGMKISKKAHSERFPYGYYRFETLVSLAISVLVLVSGSVILRESILAVFKPHPIKAESYALAVSALSIPVLILLSRHTERVGNELNSQSLLSQSADFKADIYSSFLVIVGVSASIFGYPLIEGLVGSIISLIVIKMGVTLSWQTLLVLMDAVVNPDRIMKIKEIAENVRGVRKASKIRIRRTGPFCMGQVTIGVDQQLSVEHAHRISEEVENRVKEEIPSVESLIVQVEPQKQEKIRVAIPVGEDKGMKSITSEHFGEAPYFLFVDVENEKVQRWFTKNNPALSLDRKKGVAISELITGENATTLLTAEIGDGPYHILNDSFIEIFELQKEAEAEEVVGNFIEGKLARKQS